MTTKAMDSWSDSSSLHMTLLSLSVVLCFSLLCGFSPVCVMRRARLSSDTGHRVLVLASCLSSGVFLAACLLDLLPDYMMGMKDTFSRLGVILHFPLTEFVLGMGFLVVLVVEQMLLAFREPACDVSLEKQVLIDAPGRSGRGLEDGRTHAGLRAFLLLLCLCVCSLQDGLSATARHERLPQAAAVALLFYQGLLAFSLAVRLAHLGLRRGVVSGCLLLFCVSCPAGMGVGLALEGVKARPQMELVRCAVQGLTAGIFTNVSVGGLMWRDSASPKHRMHRVAFLLTGFALVTAVLFSKV